MTLLSVISGPLIGAVIGYITNYIAIRMLFRPSEPKYIFGHRVPFTPGIVPRRKNALAKALGDAIVAKFFNADDLEIVFTSESFTDAVADALVRLLRSDAQLKGASANIPEELRSRFREELCVRMQEAAYKSALPERMIQTFLKSRKKDYGDGVFNQAAFDAADALSARMAGDLGELLIEEGRDLLLPTLDLEMQILGDTRVRELTDALECTDETLHTTLKSIYLQFMKTNVRPIVESIDVGGMITEKIIQMTALEVEDLVLDVVHRELNLVVLFGALVGAVIGAVNIFL